MKAYRWVTALAAVLIAACEVLSLAAGTGTASAAVPATCDMRLGIVLTPDVPDPGDGGFLSSLLSNHVGYELTLQRQDSDSLVLDLSGPGPESRCWSVVETIRRDAHVLSIDVTPQLGSTADVPTDSDDTGSVAVIGSPWQPQEDTHLSRAGLGSLSWAARNPAQAWRVLAPVQPGDAAYADFRASCAVSTNARTGNPACP